MNENTKILELFPTPVFIHTIKDDLEKEIEYLNTLKDSNERYDNYDYILKNEKLTKLRELLLNASNYFSKECLSIKGKVVLQQSWVNCKTCSTQWHRHKNSVVSGVFYYGEEYSQCFMIERPESTSNTYMLDPDMDEEKFHSCKFTMQSTAIRPQHKMLILFPSYLPHAVFPLNPQEEIKVLHKSLAFNLIPQNYLGNKHFLNQFNYIVKEEDLS